MNPGEKRSELKFLRVRLAGGRRLNLRPPVHREALKAGFYFYEEKLRTMGPMTKDVQWVEKEPQSDKDS